MACSLVDSRCWTFHAVISQEVATRVSHGILHDLHRNFSKLLWTSDTVSGFQLLGDGKMSLLRRKTVNNSSTAEEDILDEDGKKF